MATFPTLGSTLVPSLAQAATIGNPQGQQRQVQELAQLLAGYQQAQAGLDRAEQLQNSDFVPNSGALGFLAQVASAYKGGQLRKREGERASDFAQRILQAQQQQKMDEQLAEENRKMASERQKIAERLAVIRRGDPNELLAYDIKSGDEPGGELIQDPTTGAYFRVRGTQAIPVQLDAAGQPVAGQQFRDFDGMPAVIDPGTTPQDARAVVQGPRAWTQNTPDIVGGGGGGGQFRTTPKPSGRDTYRVATAEEIEAAGLPSGSSAQINEATGHLSVINKPDARSGTGSVLPLSAGEAAKVRTQFKETRDALGTFQALDKTLAEVPGNIGTALDPEKRGRLGTAYNNARASLRILYNTGVLQPGELPLLEEALRNPASTTGLLDPRTRSQVRGQLDELYRTVERNIQTQVESYPQIFNQQRFQESLQQRQQSHQSPSNDDDLINKYL